MSELNPLWYKNARAFCKHSETARIYILNELDETTEVDLLIIVQC